MKRKLKKAIASLLVLMLIVVSVPMSAMALSTDKVSIGIAAVNLPTTLMNNLRRNQAQFNGNIPNLLTNKPSNVTTTDGLATCVTEINNLPKKPTELTENDKKPAEGGNPAGPYFGASVTKGSGTETDPYEVDKGSLFILAVDLDLTSTAMEDGKAKEGLGANSSFSIDHPSGAFTYDASGKGAIKGSLMVTDAMSLFGTLYGDDAPDYYPGDTIYTPTCTQIKNIQVKDGTNLTDTLFVNFTGGTNYLPKASKWDVYIPLVAAKAGTHKLEVEKYDTSADIPDFNAGSGHSPAGLNVRRGRTGVTANSLGADGGLKNSESIVTTPIYIKVVSSAPTIDIAEKQKLDPVNNATIDVTATKGTFTDNTASKYHVFAGASEVASAVTNAAASADKKKTTLTIDATKLTAGTDYTIKVDADAITGATEQLTDAAETQNKFTVKPAITGTAAISGTETYGQTLTASYTGGNVGDDNVAYAWYRSTASGFEVIKDASNNAVTGETYTLAKADVGKTIKVVVSDSTGDIYGTKDATTTGTIGKIALGTPAAGKITVPAIQQNADPKTVTGSYTFLADDGIINKDTVTTTFTATYSDVSNPGTDSNVSVALDTLTNDYYTFTSQTVTGVSGTVSEAGYALGNLTLSDKTTKILTWSPATVTTKGGTATATVTVNAGETLSDFKALKVGADGKPTTTEVGTLTGSLSGTTYTLTYTAPNSDISGLTNVVFTASNAKTANVTIAIDDKDYDGTGTITDDMITVTGGATGAQKADFGITAYYADGNAADGKAVTIEATKTEITPEGSDTTYKLTTTGVTGNIKPLAADVTANVSTKIAPDAKIADVLTAIKGAAIKVGTVTESQGTVGDYFTDAQLETALEGVTGVTHTEAKPAVTKTEGATLPGNDVSAYVVGNTYTIAAADAATATFGGKDFATLDDDSDDTVTLNGLTITKDGEGNLTIAVGTEAISTDTTVVVGAATTTFKAATPVAESEEVKEAWDFSALANKDLKFNLDLSTVAVDKRVGKLFTNVKVQNDDGSYRTLAVTVPVNGKGGTTTGGGVSFDTQGYGKAEFETGEINSDGKLTALPKVTVKVGLEFVRWYVDGNVNRPVDIETYEPEDGETITAYIRGYMVGGGDGTVRPTARITRKELAKMLVVAAGVYDSTVDYTKDPANLFPDMPHDGWSDNYIACAKKNGIMKGNDLGKGTPNADISREEAAAMIARVFGVKTSATDTTDKVNDFDKVTDWAKEYVAALCNNGTINGKPDGSFSGKLSIQRAEAAKMVNIYLGLDETKKTTIKNDSSIKNPFSDIKDDSQWAYADLMFASKSVPATFYVDKITVPEAK